MEENQYNRCHEPAGYRSIWISTIVQALVDAVSVNRDPPLQKAKREAIEWLSQPNKDSDFATVCEMANIEPAVVKNLLNAIIEGRSKRANFRWWRRDETLPRKPIGATQNQQQPKTTTNEGGSND